MDSFKLALKSALAKKADALCLKVGSFPLVFRDGEVIELKDHTAVLASELQELIPTLLPEVKVQPNKPHRGEVSVINFGDIDIIGSLAHPAELWSFFRPSGSVYLNQAWEKLKVQSVKEEVVHEAPQHMPSSNPISHFEESESDSFRLVSETDQGESFLSNSGENHELRNETDGFNLDYENEIPESRYDPQQYIPQELGFSSLDSAPVASSKDGAYTESSSTVELPQRRREKISFGPHLPGDLISSGLKPIDRLLQLMVESGASDLHLTQKQPPSIRMDGEIHRLSESNLDSAAMEAYILPIMSEKKEAEFIDKNDVDFAYVIAGLGRFRVNVFRDLYGVGAVIRQIPETVLTAEQIGLSDTIRAMCRLNKGLVLVTGPTGSGKSTTLAAMIDLINKTRKDHIVTIEDPVEFVHQSQSCLVNQREVYQHTKSFSSALKAVLREDPDVILVGEMRDLETVSTALEIAETGHLVFGTLHTNSASSTVDRIVDQFPADRQSQIRVMLSSTLKGVISQILVPKQGGGRCAAQEVLVVDRAVSSMIREGNSHLLNNHMQTQKKVGNILLNEALIDLVKQGIISLEMAYNKSTSKETLVQLAQSQGLNLSSLAS